MVKTLGRFIDISSVTNKKIELPQAPPTPTGISHHFAQFLRVSQTCWTRHIWCLFAASCVTIACATPGHCVSQDPGSGESSSSYSYVAWPDAAHHTTMATWQGSTSDQCLRLKHFVDNLIFCWQLYFSVGKTQNQFSIWTCTFSFVQWITSYNCGTMIWKQMCSNTAMNVKCHYV